MKRVRWTPVNLINRIKMAKDSKLVPLYSEDLKGAGIGIVDMNLVLYCRKRFQEQFQFLSDRVIKNERFGWVLGPPDTGKSCATYVFLVSELNRADWVVTWIHISRYINPICVCIDGDQKKRVWVDEGYSVGDIVRAYSGPKKHLVVLDGYAVTVDGHLYHLRV